MPGIEYKDLRIVREGELTSDKKSKIKITKAIEVGHIFKLGTKYSEALGAKFLDADGKENPIIMGSYGIGVERTTAAYIEQNNDEKGIIWKGEIAPFSVIIISLNQNNEDIKTLSENFYKEFLNKGMEVLFDDRAEVRPGVKFNDADLIGIPVQLIIGEKNLKEGNVEIKIRKSGERLIVKKEDAFAKINELIKNN